MKRKALLAGTFFAGVAVGMLGMWLRMTSVATPPSNELLAEAKKSLASGHYDQAAAVAAQISENDGLRRESLLILGEVAARQNRLDEAVALYNQIPDDGSDSDIKGTLASGDIHLTQAHLQRALADFQYVLDRRPEEIFAINRVAFILGISGRRFESIKHLRELVYADQFSPNQLALLGGNEVTAGITEELHRDLPDAEDSLLNLTNCRYKISENELELSRKFAQAALAIDPDLVEAKLRIGESLLLEQDMHGFAEWHAQLDGSEDWHPDLWVFRGQWAELNAQPEAALRCYREAIQRDPNRRVAIYKLGQLLPADKFAEPRQKFAERGRLLTEIQDHAYLLFNSPQHLPSIKQIFEKCVEIGRFWEAWGWSRSALVVSPQLAWASEGKAHVEQYLAADLPPIAEDYDPRRWLDLLEFPLPDFSQPSASGADTHPIANIDDGGIRFVEQAEELGVTFNYFNSPDETTSGRRMFEMTGGGVAVLDYDLDGFPDLYWTQGCDFPPQAGQRDYLDPLYRNRGDHFTDVTQPCRIREEGFGQGVNVGDVNQDGFDDLYVANLYRNRLFLNQGDGTFLDITEEAGLTGQKWTTNCLIADLNGDAIPELFDVNYAEADDIFTRICDRQGMDRTCIPSAFPASQDALHWSDGAGRFQEIGSSAGIHQPDGRGLGIVAFSTGQERRRLNLFVANDMTANHLFINETEDALSAPHLVESALPSGVAFDEAGRAQACMGVAAADANGDGSLDFLVTNFYAESNNLYLQVAPNLFRDAIHQTGIRTISTPILGFGTQFLDADLDSWPDLIVTNGHIDDFTHMDVPYEMPPQLLRNIEGRQFVQLESESLGPFFAGNYLGRGLATLDWNRDFKPDVAISHIDSPAVLLTNQTPRPGHALRLKLVGVDVDREAIGTIVEVLLGDGRRLTHQLTAGSGYQAANERVLTFGLGDAQRIEQVDVYWTDGTHQTLTGLQEGREYIIVQWRDTAAIAYSAK